MLALNIFRHFACSFVFLPLSTVFGFLDMYSLWTGHQKTEAKLHTSAHAAKAKSKCAAGGS